MGISVRASVVVGWVVLGALGGCGDDDATTTPTTDAGCNELSTAIEDRLLATLDCEAPVIFSDEELAEDDWEVFGVRRSGSGAFAQTAVTAESCGNAYREMTHAWTGQVFVFHISKNATYDPATEGSIASIDYAEDHFGGPQGYALALEQAGALYLAPSSGAIDATTWRRVQVNDLVAASFTTTEGMRPDFSGTGEPIRFGYVRTNTLASAANVYTHGIDNWTVRLCKVPVDMPDGGEPDAD